MKRSEIVRKAMANYLRTSSDDKDKDQFICLAVGKVYSSSGLVNDLVIAGHISDMIGGYICVEVYLSNSIKRKPTFEECYTLRQEIASKLIKKYEAEND